MSRVQAVTDDLDSLRSSALDRAATMTCFDGGPTIAAFDARLIRVPLTRPWAADVTSVGVIATHVVRSDGAEGWGFSWTPQIGDDAVHALLAHDIAVFAVGRTLGPARDDEDDDQASSSSSETAYHSNS